PAGIAIQLRAFDAELLTGGRVDTAAAFGDQSRCTHRDTLHVVRAAAGVRLLRISVVLMHPWVLPPVKSPTAAESPVEGRRSAECAALPVAPRPRLGSGSRPGSPAPGTRRRRPARRRPSGTGRGSGRRWRCR